MGQSLHNYPPKAGLLLLETENYFLAYKMIQIKD
jgi:hypothetical protein